MDPLIWSFCTVILPLIFPLLPPSLPAYLPPPHLHIFIICLLPLTSPTPSSFTAFYLFSSFQFLPSKSKAERTNRKTSWENLRKRLTANFLLAVFPQNDWIYNAWILPAKLKNGSYIHLWPKFYVRWNKGAGKICLFPFLWESGEKINTTLMSVRQGCHLDFFFSPE